ncbi:hypothetical protein D3C78_817360 [compost metagenome]
MTNLRAGLGQGVHVIDIEGIQRRMDAIVQAALLEEVPVGLGSGGETTRYGNAGTGKIADHFAQGCVLAPHMFDVMHAELIEGNYVLYQGDLSTNCWKSSNRAGAAPPFPGLGLKNK